jgi:hypothetical protein
LGEHGHPQSTQNIPQGQLTKNSISNGPHELRRQLDHSRQQFAPSLFFVVANTFSIRNRGGSSRAIGPGSG